MIGIATFSDKSTTIVQGMQDLENKVLTLVRLVVSTTVHDSPNDLVLFTPYILSLG